MSYIRKQLGHNTFYLLGGSRGAFIPDLNRYCQITYRIPDSDIPVTVIEPEELSHIDYVLWSINLDMKLFGYETDFSRTIPEIIKNK